MQIGRKHFPERSALSPESYFLMKGRKPQIGYLTKFIIYIKRVMESYIWLTFRPTSRKIFETTSSLQFDVLVFLASGMRSMLPVFIVGTSSSKKIVIVQKRC